jgi:polyisoprenoid-binding protein YceI
MKVLTRLACCLLLQSAPGLLFADPGQWNSVAANSELGFSAWYEGEELTGQFADFDVRLETDDREINAEIVEPDWFDVQAFPNASYESSDIRPADTGFLASGRLRIKGIEQALEIPLDWSREGDTAILSGTVTLSRQAWRVGTGEWSNNASLADRVDVRWRVTLVPAD